METQWISVNDRLPEFEKDVLLFDDWLTVDKKERKQDVRIGYLESFETRKSSSGITKYCEWRAEFAFNITHWMPLPEPPKH